MKKLLLTLLAFAPLFLFSQGTISGIITDAETNLPLEGASIFAQNTTKGTTTDKQGTYRLFLTRGSYEINVSFTGYATRTINVEMMTDRVFNLSLQKADQSMAEIIIKNSNEVSDGWEKYGKFFISQFIGTTANADSCVLTNPEVLKFLYFKRTDRLKVLATEPLVIRNNALGYNLRYELDSLVYFFKTDVSSYRGKCLFLPITPDSLQAIRWVKARKETYAGSRMHFLRSYNDSTLTKEGFTVQLYAEKSYTKFNVLKNPYDSTYYYFNDSTASAELFFPVKVCVIYNGRFPEKRYLEQNNLPLDVPVQISYVDLTDAILIHPTGYFTPQKNWLSQGYWSWKNLADMLPYDYEGNTKDK